MIAVLLISLSVFAEDYGKKILEIESPQPVEIELPDHQIKDFGQDYYLRMVSELVKKEKYVVLDQIAENQRVQTSDEFVWRGRVIPAARLRIHLSAMSFVTGSRGNRMFYGFDEKNEKIGIQNEFSIKNKNNPEKYFYESFRSKGDTETGTLSGLDLGEGISLDVIFAFLKVKYATYRARMKLDLVFQIPATGEEISRTLDTKAKGFFYDVVGGYLGYYGGLVIARRDAWLKSFNYLTQGSLIQIEKVLESMPLTGVVNEIVQTNRGTRYLIGTGFSSKIKSGTQYSNATNTHVFEVEDSVSSGSICVLVSGDPLTVQRNMNLTEWNEEIFRKIVSLSQEQQESTLDIELPDQNISKTVLGNKDLDKEKKPNIWTQIKRTILLPYRIWRYYNYDQKLKSKQSIYNGEPLVAVIDTGVDYNRSKMKNHLWINPVESRARYGWDFVSGDARPFDDHYHGTEIALAALSQMRNGKIMSIKAFNPWGVTSSDHLVRAMKYAAQNGAKVVLTAWKTWVDSKALKQMDQIAREQGMIWVTPGEFESDHAAAKRAGVIAQSLAK